MKKWIGLSIWIAAAFGIYYLWQTYGKDLVGNFKGIASGFVNNGGGLGNDTSARVPGNTSPSTISGDFGP